MERLVFICLLLALISVQFVFSEHEIKVNINPNTETLYYEFRKGHKENLTCESDCPNCKYRWYLKRNGKFQDIFKEGKFLFLNEVVNRRNIFMCHVFEPKDPVKYYGYSSTIKVIIKDNRLPIPTTYGVSSANTVYPSSTTAGKNNRLPIQTTYGVSVIQSSANTVYPSSTTAEKSVKNDESSLSDEFVVIVACGASGLLVVVIAVLVGFLCVKKRKTQNKIHNGLEMTENSLYISADIISEIPTSNRAQNMIPTKESENDVYSVVKKTKKNENHSSEYAEIRISQPQKQTVNGNGSIGEGKPSMETDPSGKNVPKDGMVYLEIDFKDMASNGKSAMQGEENKTLYIDTDAIKYGDPLPKSDEEEIHHSRQDGKDLNAQ